MSRKHSPKFARFALFYTHYVHAGVCLHLKVLMRVKVELEPVPRNVQKRLQKQIKISTFGTITYINIKFTIV